jgi:hypothetical protein
MTREDWVKFHQGFFESAHAISQAKNADYTGASADPFANLRSVEQLGIPTEIGLLTRMMDKMARLASFTQKNELQVKDESVMDTCKDLANYCALFAGFVESQKARTGVRDQD